MDFSEKISKLLTLTQTQSAHLAKSIYLDPSQISRMKTGMRGRPKNYETLKSMADFFATHCASDYRLSALSELTGDKRILASPSEQLCSKAIFKWLCSTDENETEHMMGTFLQRIDSFSMLDATEVDEENILSSLRGDNQFISYTDNVGKRQAVLEFLESVLSEEDPGEVYLFTDENVEWVYEDASFVCRLDDCIHRLALAGCHFSRIGPPEQNLNYTLGNIERWLPAYMLGNTREFYYPRARDVLHRRSLFVAPGKAAVFSRSLAEQKESRLTMFCADKNMVDICYQEYMDILQLCKPMMRVYTTKEAEEMFRSRLQITAIPAHGIYLNATLSIVSLPIEILERAQVERDLPLARMMLKNHLACYSILTKVLTDHTIEDIISLSDPQDVLDGKVPVPSTILLPGGPVYYKPDEYKLHLQKTIEMMETYDNYQVFLLDNPYLKGISLSCKCDQRVLMIKSQDPFAIFEISDQRFAASFCEFLRQVVNYERARTDRTGTILKLKEAIDQL